MFFTKKYSTRKNPCTVHIAENSVAAGEGTVKTANDLVTGAGKSL